MYAGKKFKALDNNKLVVIIVFVLNGVTLLYLEECREKD